MALTHEVRWCLYQSTVAVLAHSRYCDYLNILALLYLCTFQQSNIIIHLVIVIVKRMTSAIFMDYTADVCRTVTDVLINYSV